MEDRPKQVVCIKEKNSATTVRPSGFDDFLNKMEVILEQYEEIKEGNEKWSTNLIKDFENYELELLHAKTLQEVLLIEEAILCRKKNVRVTPGKEGEELADNYDTLIKKIRNKRELLSLPAPEITPIKKAGRPKAEVKRFEEYLSPNVPNEIMDALRNLLTGKIGKDVAIVIRALIEGGFIESTPSAPAAAALYRSMRASFGDIGEDSGIDIYYTGGKKDEIKEEVTNTIQKLTAI